MYAPGPIISSHHPGAPWPAPVRPVTWESPVHAWQISTAFDASASSSPHVSYATVTLRSTSPLSTANGCSVANVKNGRLPGGSPGCHAPGGGSDSVAISVLSVVRVVGLV